jgi:hypothetical protein
MAQICPSDAHFHNEETAFAYVERSFGPTASLVRIARTPIADLRCTSSDRLTACRRSAVAGGRERRTDHVRQDRRKESAEPARRANPDRKDTHWGKRKLKRDE